jgi:diguanylate cyclase (GGDEF)-like protein/PAS domain S-box-containing protein
VTSEGQLEIDLKRISQWSLFLVALISGVSLLGWFLGVGIVTRLRMDYIPIAPSTALCFSMLSSSLLTYVLRPESFARRGLAVFSAGLTLSVSLAIVIGFFLNISSDAEHLWLNTASPVGNVPSGHMSPLTAIAFFTAAAGVLFLVFSSPTRVRLKNSAAFAGITVSVFGFIVLVGYAYGTPLLYGGTIIPIALPTAVAFVLSGIGLTAASGPAVLPFRVFAGQTVRSQLMKSFLPALIILVLAEGLLYKTTYTKTVNPALLSSFIAILSVLVVALLITRLSKSIGGQIDQAHAAFERAEKALRLDSEIISKMEEGVFLVRVTDLVIAYANPKFEKMFGYRQGEMVGENISILNASSRTAPVLTAGVVATALREAGMWTGEVRTIRKDGTLFWCYGTVSSFEHHTYGIVWLAIYEDVTGRKQMEEELRKTETEYKNLFDTSLDGIYQVNAEGVFILMNPAGAKIFGHKDPSEMIGRNALEYWRDPKDRESFRKELKVKKAVSAYHMRARKINGEPIELESSSIMIADENGNFLGIKGILRDITDRKRMEVQLHELSFTDELTRLYNRRGFYDLAGRELNMAKRLKRNLCILSADMDGLKAINDNLGHKEGDKALIMTANILRETFRNVDIIARLGGDEFVVVPTGITKTDTHLVIARLQKLLAIFNAGKGESWKLSLSTGIGYYDHENPCSLDELLIQADTMMYEQKRSKRNNSNNK